MSTNPNLGFVAIWYDGVEQTFSDGSKTMFYATMSAGVNDAGPNRVYANNYRKKGWISGAVTVYHDARYPRVATTLAEATAAPQP